MTEEALNEFQKAVQFGGNFFDSLTEEEKGRYIETMLALNPHLLNSEFLNDPDIAK